MDRRWIGGIKRGMGLRESGCIHIVYICGDKMSKDDASKTY